MAKAAAVASPATKQAPPAEERYAEELAFLKRIDVGAKPPGFLLSPEAVVTFIVGSGGTPLMAKPGKGANADTTAMTISEKFVGDRSLVERCVVTLAGQRGLLLVGEPGTAKSMLSELLSAAISGTSQLTVQGTAGTHEEHLRYGFNYALLLQEGPSERALLASPVMSAMDDGKLVRVEEITRCLPEVQDALVSVLSERTMAIPELKTVRSARPGFNVIGTANLKDRGVSEMSAALKRRFNFEVVPAIADIERERQLVTKQARAVLDQTSPSIAIDEAVVHALVTAFRDLRQGRTEEGWAVDKPSSVMSTAEAVAVAVAVSLQGSFFAHHHHQSMVRLLPEHLLGVVQKDDDKDQARLLSYFDGPVRRRADGGQEVWRTLWEHRARLVT
jgi:MoxR-like ATPase